MMKIIIANACRQTATIGLFVVAYIYYGILSTGLVLSTKVAASQTSVLFQTTLLQSACTIDFVDANGRALPALDLGPVDSSLPGFSPANGKGGINPAGTLFRLELSGCGIASATTMPTIKLTGKQFDSASDPEIDAQVNSKLYKLKDPSPGGGTSRGYFVVVGGGVPLVYNGASASTPNGLYKVGDKILTKAKKGESGEGLKVDLYATVACDDGCNYINAKKPTAVARGGSLHASLQFEFSYQ